MLIKYSYSVLKKPREKDDNKNDFLMNPAARALLESEKRINITEKVNLKISDISEKINKRKYYIQFRKIIEKICNEIATKYYKEQWREPILTYFEDKNYEFHMNLGCDGQFSCNLENDIDEIEFTGDIIKKLMEYKADWMKKTGWDKI